MKVKDVATIKEIINDIIVEVVGGSMTHDDISPEMTLVGDGGVDSMKLLEIALTIAAEFDIDVPKEEVMNLKTMQDVYTFVASKKGLVL